ncbi:MAG: type II toxin-antitoxin system Phd/YefM family antitoxin [Thermodesulfobacteriota bacterium]|jgi:antitoxin Phd
MDKTVSVAEAKNKLPSIIHEVEQGATVKITRHGKSVAVVVRQRNYEQLMEKGQGFWKSLGKFRNLLSSEGIVFTESDFIDLRDRTVGRSFSWNE